MGRKYESQKVVSSCCKSAKVGGMALQVALYGVPPSEDFIYVLSMSSPSCILKTVLSQTKLIQLMF